MCSTFLFVYVLLLVISSCISEEAKLLLYKKLETTPPVELEDMVISYNIINTGDGPAYNIEIIDSYQSSSFEVSSVKPEGDLIVLNIDEIAPQDSHEAYLLVAKELGYDALGKPENEDTFEAYRQDPGTVTERRWALLNWQRPDASAWHST